MKGIAKASHRHDEIQTPYTYPVHTNVSHVKTDIPRESRRRVQTIRELL